MRTKIFKNEEDAITEAKNQAGVNEGDKFKIQNSSCQCDCGETAAIHIINWQKEITSDSYGLAGVCESYGE